MQVDLGTPSVTQSSMRRQKDYFRLLPLDHGIGTCAAQGRKKIKQKRVGSSVSPTQSSRVASQGGAAHSEWLGSEPLRCAAVSRRFLHFFVGAAHAHHPEARQRSAKQQPCTLHPVCRCASLDFRIRAPWSALPHSLSSPLVTITSAPSTLFPQSLSSTASSLTATARIRRCRHSEPSSDPASPRRSPPPRRRLRRRSRSAPSTRRAVRSSSPSSTCLPCRPP